MGDGMKCGHPRELAVVSAETGEILFCDLCNCRSRCRDAEKAEAALQAENTALRAERDDWKRKWEGCMASLKDWDDDCGKAQAERDAAREALRKLAGDVQFVAERMDGCTEGRMALSLERLDAWSVRLRAALDATPGRDVP